MTYREAVSLGVDQIERGFFHMADFQPHKLAGRCDDAKQAESLIRLSADEERVQALFAYLIDHHVTITATPAV